MPFRETRARALGEDGQKLGACGWGQDKCTLEMDTGGQMFMLLFKNIYLPHCIAQALSYQDKQDTALFSEGLYLVEERAI